MAQSMKDSLANRRIPFTRDSLVFGKKIRASLAAFPRMRFQAVVFDFVSGQGEGRIQEFCCFLKANTFCSGAVARETGGENIKARMVSARLHCSTQPVMHHFATIEALKWQFMRRRSIAIRNIG